MRKDYIFTSESVSEGHPDKVSDRISDMVVDHFIAKDPFARVACETLTTTNKVVLAGEIRGPVQEDKDEIISKVRDCIKDIGYEQEGFHWQNADVQYLLHGPVLVTQEEDECPDTTLNIGRFSNTPHILGLTNPGQICYAYVCIQMCYRDPFFKRAILNMPTSDVDLISFIAKKGIEDTIPYFRKCLC